MTTEYDSKGKVFTRIVPKDAVPVRIQTTLNLIVGYIYLKHEDRIKDELELTDHFIAVTSAKVYRPGGELDYEAAFITVNRNHIIWLAPENEPPTH